MFQTSGQSARKSQCPFVSTRRQQKPAENNGISISLESVATASLRSSDDPELESTNSAMTPAFIDNSACASSVYSKLILLRMRYTSKRGAEAEAVKMRPVTELPEVFQMPDWQQRNPAKAMVDPKVAVDDESVLNDVRSILSKLTADSFGTLFQSLMNCCVDTPDRLAILMTEVFDTATKQQPHVPMYADLCENLAKDSRISALLESAQDSFPQLLLRKCQNFMTNLFRSRTDEQSLGKMQLEEEGLHRKQQALGHIKLIGHLLVKKLIASKMFVEWAGDLLAKRESCPEALEALAALLMVAGPEFDTSTWEHFARLQEIIVLIRKVAKSKSTPARARFILKDVLDARDAGWLNSKESRNAQHAQNDDAIAESADPRLASRKLDNNVQLQPADKLDVSLFDIVAFRRVLASVLADLIASQNVSAAVQRIRLQQVPIACQVQQTADVLTRILEEKRGPHRRRAIAFAVGLVASEQRAFDRQMFLDGLGVFFRDVYDELCHEVPRLPSMISTELVPVLLGVYSKDEIASVSPVGLYCPALRA